jgi:hypothetical protein
LGIVDLSPVCQGREIIAIPLPLSRLSMWPCAYGGEFDVDERGGWRCGVDVVPDGEGGCAEREIFLRRTL